MPHPDCDPIDAAIDQLVAAHSAVEPTPEAVSRWRRSLRTSPGPERYLGFSARSWAGACVACLLLAGAMTALAWLEGTVPPPRIVFLPPPAPVISEPATAVPQSARAVAPPAKPAKVYVPATVRVASPTAQEQLLSRLAAEQPATLTELFKGVPAIPEGAQP